MQQDPLIRRREAERGAGLLGGHPFDVTHGYYLTLPRRERRDRPVELAKSFPESAAFSGAVPHRKITRMVSVTTARILRRRLNSTGYHVDLSRQYGR
jgi:hypothetical protein